MSAAKEENYLLMIIMIMFYIKQINYTLVR